MPIHILSFPSEVAIDSIVGGFNSNDRSSSGSLTVDLDNATSKDTCS